MSEIIPRRNAILYHLTEGDVYLENNTPFLITDGELWIYANGEVKSFGMLSREIRREESQNRLIVSLDTLEPL